MVLHLYEIEYHPPMQECYVPSSVDICSEDSEGAINMFSLCRFNLPLEQGVVFDLNKLEYRLIKLLCAKWFWSERFFKVVNVFSFYRYYI